MAQKKCIYSLPINIFGINLNEISISGWECNIMFSQQMAQALHSYTGWSTRKHRNVVCSYHAGHITERSSYSSSARQCLDADGCHFEHLHWFQNSRTSLISILLLYKYSSYNYRVILFMSKCVYIYFGPLCIYDISSLRVKIQASSKALSHSARKGWYSEASALLNGTREINTFHPPQTFSNT